MFICLCVYHILWVTTKFGKRIFLVLEVNKKNIIQVVQKLFSNDQSAYRLASLKI